MRVGVIGTGHVGLVTAATLASLGHGVAAVDSDAEKIDILRRGEPPFFEPCLHEWVDEQVAAGRLSFDTRARRSCPAPSARQLHGPDISLARLELGWEPKVPLDTGLERMVAWASEAWTT